jgi:hypothetical protein
MRNRTSHSAMAFFLAQWIEVERLFRARVSQSENRRPSVPTRSALRSLGLLDDRDAAADFERIRRLCNNLVHGIEVNQPDGPSGGRS